MLQFVVVCCSVLQCVAVSQSRVWLDGDGTATQCVAVSCSVLQCVAVCYSVLQCVAVSQWHDGDGTAEVTEGMRDSGDCGADNAPEISQKLALRS